MPIVTIQRRMMELGRIRLGDKGPKGEPRKLDKFRLTSASKALLDAASKVYGGTVRVWENAPDEGYFELYTDADLLDVILPPIFSDRDGAPTYSYSQWFEQWSAAGCQRRCDGETEILTGKPCLCEALIQDGQDRACKVTTRVNVMLHKIPGLGVWRCESHGYNAAAVLPGTLDVLQMAAAEQKFIPAVLRLEHKTVKRDGQTRKFVVPVIDLPNATVTQLASGEVQSAINPPVPRPPRPELPAAVAPPEGGDFGNGTRGDFGERPALPTPGPGGKPQFLENGAMSKEQLDANLKREGITRAQLGAAGKVLFPGRKLGDLDDVERGKLWRAVAAGAES